MKSYSSITLNSLDLRVNLGWQQGERAKPQIISLDVTIKHAHPPRACETDQLEDTHCYDALIQQIKTELASSQFRLIEYLAREVHRIIKQFLATDAKVQVCITKKPAILSLTGGVTFCYGENE